MSALTLVLGLSGCAKSTKTLALALKDEGRVVAQTSFHSANSLVSQGADIPDCKGKPFAVTVDSVHDSESYIYDEAGEPCAKAKVLFDGSTEVGQRAPSQQVYIGFKDAMGTEPSFEGAAVIGVQTIGAPISATSPDEFASGGIISPNVGIEDTSELNLDKTIQLWAAQAERKHLLKQSEKLLADMRSLDRVSEQEAIKLHQQKIEELMAKLREAERRADQEKNQYESILSRMDQMKARESSKRVAAQQQQGRLEADLYAMKEKLQDFETANRRLAMHKAAREKMFMTQVTKLKKNIHAAEKEADTQRLSLVREAAAKIAEAERYAFAARMGESASNAREADRLKAESDLLMQRAINLQQGRTIIVPELAESLDYFYTPDSVKPYLPLAKVPVVVVAKNETLEQILEKIMKQVKPSAGNWQVTWQLEGKNQYILLETWTMAAEAKFEEIMAFIANKVKETHGISLSFKEFNKNHTLVISDDI